MRSADRRPHPAKHQLATKVVVPDLLGRHALGVEHGGNRVVPSSGLVERPGDVEEVANSPLGG